MQWHVTRMQEWSVRPAEGALGAESAGGRELLRAVAAWEVAARVVTAVRWAESHLKHSHVSKHGCFALLVRVGAELRRHVD